MKEHLAFILIFITIVCLSGSNFAQIFTGDPLTTNNISSAPRLSPGDSAALCNLPEILPDAQSLKSQLPYSVNNSKQPYFRPFYRQISVECGQYSGIAFNFCYEINRLRDLPANQPENQYPAHFTFNFMNDGYGWHGVSYQHSWEIVKSIGHMNVVDYGIDTGYNSRVWISGYEKYYRGMFNKIDETYQLKVGTPEGLLTLKNWLHNHLEGDEVGGIASFYSSSPWTATTLPEGTPEGGKHVIAFFSPNVGHANTIVGYNDSIRFDYNQDGQYTNNLDINGDEVVDMRDWEIGGLLFMDSYIDGIHWADSGFCYMMYKTLAETPQTGGIWNHAVHLVKPKAAYAPLLTMKFGLVYNCRERIKIYAGVAQDEKATYPEHVLHFPVFDYQGACMNMQGGNSPDSAFLEAGLDVTPLLSYIEPNQPAQFFLMIHEQDAEGWGHGTINEMTLIDYTHDSIQHHAPLLPAPITNNGLTQTSVWASIDFSKPVISPETLPLGLTGEPFQQQLSCQGGEAPYQWKLLYKYDQSLNTALLPPISGTALLFDDTINAQQVAQLEFEFPFYGEKHAQIFVHTDGFVMFDDQQYPWPYMYDEALMIRNTKIIAPFLNKHLYIDAEAGDGVWIDKNDQWAIIRWKMSSDILDSANIEFELRLYANGNIQFAYGQEDLFIDHNWGAGLSLGDDQNFTFAGISNQQKMPSNSTILFTYPQFVSELSLTNNGLLWGTPEKNYNQVPVYVWVKDNNNMTAEKQFNFTSWYAGTNEAETQEGLWVWPNPANDVLRIKFQNNQVSLLELTLKNMHGQTVQSKSIQAEVGGHTTYHWPIGPTLASGVYLLQVKTELKTYQQKVIVNH